MQIWIDGVPVAAIGNGYFGDVELIDRWPGGPFEATFGLALPPGFRHPVLQRGREVVFTDAAARRWGGTIADIDRDTWKITADGYCRQAESTPALTGAGATSAVPDTVIDAAIARGELVGWRRAASYGASPLTTATTTDELNTVDTLLTDYAALAGQRWSVDADGYVARATDAVTPTLYLAPGNLDVGVVDDQYATHVFLRYRDATNAGAYTTASVVDQVAADSFDPKSITESAVDLGPITPTKAVALATALLNRMRPRLGWTESIEINGSQLTDMTGQPADLLSVTAGRVLRIFGSYDEQSGAGVVDAVVGESRYTPGARTITLAPMNRTPMTQAEVWEAVQTRAARKRFKA